MSTSRSKDRSSDCTFTFADGRRCRMPRQSGHPFLCCFHARKEAQAQSAEEVGRDIRFFLSGDYLSACNLSLALGHVFAAAARGQLKPKTAGTLAYLGQTLLQTIHLAENEYINAFGTDRWRRVIHSHVNENSNYLFPAQTTQQLPLQPSGPDQPDASVEAGLQPGLFYGSRPSAEAATQSADSLDSITPTTSSAGFTPASFPEVAAPSGHCTRRGGLQPGSSSTTATTRLSAQPSTQPSSATHEGFTLSPEGPASSSPVSRLPRRNLSQPNQEPGVSNHVAASVARNSSPTNPDSVSSAAAAYPSAEDASLPAATGLLAKVCSSAPPRLPRDAAHFAATILSSAHSTPIPSQPLPTEPYSRRVADDFAAQRHADAGAATVSVGAELQFTLRHEGPALSSPRTRPSRSSPVAKPAAPSQAPSSQNPKPAATPATGPSGAPLLAALPPRDHAPRPVRRQRQIRPWYLPE